METLTTANHSEQNNDFLIPKLSVVALVFCPALEKNLDFQVDAGVKTAIQMGQNHP